MLGLGQGTAPGVCLPGTHRPSTGMMMTPSYGARQIRAVHGPRGLNRWPCTQPELTWLVGIPSARAILCSSCATSMLPLSE